MLLIAYWCEGLLPTTNSYFSADTLPEAFARISLNKKIQPSPAQFSRTMTGGDEA
jgi:hypothetical protein